MCGILVVKIQRKTGRNSGDRNAGYTMQQLPQTKLVKSILPYRLLMNKLDTLVNTNAGLADLVQRAGQTDAIAIDTEFIWKRTYYPQLGLIQIALSDQDCYLIDPVSIKDLRLLGHLLTNRSIVKIFHDAPQDLAILQRATGAVPQNIFDTRLAAGFSDMEATLSLGSLVEQLLDIKLSKNETTTNWLQRPLTEKQIQYAIDDVRYLRAIRIIILNRIIGPKIRSWLQDELNLLNNPASYSGPPDTERYRKIRGINSLDPQGLVIIKNLCRWREGMAKKKDRPRGHVIKDSDLVAIAKHKIVSKVGLQKSCSMAPKAIDLYGDTVIDVVNVSLKQPVEDNQKRFSKKRLNNEEKKRLEKLHKLIELKCNLLGIAPSLVGNNNELKTLVQTLGERGSLAPAQLRQTEGWRKLLLEDFFRQN